MSEHFPALIIIVPLLSAFAVATAGWFNRTWCFPIAFAALAGGVLSALGLLHRVLEQGVIQYRLGGWAPPMGIAYEVDHLNGLILVVITVVALINLVATRNSVKTDFTHKRGPFYALYLLFVAGLSGIVVTGDAFNLYVLLEISAITGYALIGMGKNHAPLASLHYVLMGTIGASFYLLGIGYIYLVTGSLNMADIATILPGVYGSKVVVVAFVICLTGLFIKMALFPFHTWLPNAYTYAPVAAIGLVAPLTTKVMVYVMIRVVLTMFTPAFSFAHPLISNTLVWLAAVGIILASIMALAEKRIKRFLAYVIIAEVGYMVGGVWLGNRAGITGAILHIINDAAMTLCVFLFVGNILYKLEDDSFEHLQGVFRKMPYTMAGFVVVALSIIGVPPTCGFFSKWYLITGGIAGGHYGFVAALLFSSLVNVVLFFRIIEIGFFEPFGDHHTHDDSRHEAPLSMLVPLWVVAIGLVVLGLFTGDIVTRLIQFAIPPTIA
jgi:multicomponent Na+:H+ antiporter subunit D